MAKERRVQWDDEGEDWTPDYTETHEQLDRDRREARKRKQQHKDLREKEIHNQKEVLP